MINVLPIYHRMLFNSFGIYIEHNYFLLVGLNTIIYRVFFKRGFYIIDNW